MLYGVVLLTAVHVVINGICCVNLLRARESSDLTECWIVKYSRTKIGQVFQLKTIKVAYYTVICRLQFGQLTLSRIELGGDVIDKRDLVWLQVVDRWRAMYFRLEYSNYLY